MKKSRTLVSLLPLCFVVSLTASAAPTGPRGQADATTSQAAPNDQATVPERAPMPAASKRKPAQALGIELTEFMNRVLPTENVLEVVPGGGQVPQNNAAFQAAIRKSVVAKANICTGKTKTGWYEEGSLAILGAKKSQGLVSLYHYMNCDDSTVYTTVAVIKAPRAEKWIVLPDFMGHVDFAKAYAFVEKGDGQLIVSGWDYHPGGEVTTPRIFVLGLDEAEVRDVRELKLK